MSVIGQSPSLGSEVEAQRLAAVQRYAILDTPPDGTFDRITALAARRFQVPISIVSIVDQERIWFKSHHGIDISEIGRDPGLCASAILSDEPWVLTDAKTDIRSLANPLVAGKFGLQFYVGVQLRSTDGHNLGTLCVIDKEPKPVDASQMEDLKDLGSLVMDQLELRLAARRAVERAEIMSREIDHRVMNSLQFVSGMLRMQGRASDSPEIARHLQIAASRVQAVARVHQNFHHDGPSERAGCLSFVKRLCADLSGILETPIDISGTEALLPTVQIQPIGLIVNELVTNAAKHGGGKISVHFEREVDGQYRLSVTDQGSGLPTNFDPSAKSGSLGMIVVSTLAEQLHGRVDACPNSAGAGACFMVTFPAA
jgi:two-component sensor histidine kinase